MFILFLLIFSSQPTDLNKAFSFKIPAPLFRVSSLAYDRGDIFALDMKSSTLCKLGKSGRILETYQNRGQGPGGLSIPRSLGVSKEWVFVGTLGKIVVFNRGDLEYVRQFNIPNNPLSIAVLGEQLFLGLTTYPATHNGVFVFDFQGMQNRSFYEHQIDGHNLKMPYLAVSKNRLFVMSRVQYRTEVFGPGGEKLAQPSLVTPPKYRPIVPVKPFDDKYGKSMASALHWRTEWSESSMVAVVRDRFLVLCFKELQKDLRSDRYFISVYDLQTDKRVIAWKETGNLLCGGEFAFFQEEGEEEDFVVAYKVGNL